MKYFWKYKVYVIRIVFYGKDIIINFMVFICMVGWKGNKLIVMLV